MEVVKNKKILCLTEVMPPNAVSSCLGDGSSSYDKAKEVGAFNETKAGVKGLVDSGVTKIPRFFCPPTGERAKPVIRDEQ